MLVQTTRARNPALAAEPLPEPKVAVLLNANAKKVTEKVINRVGHVVPEEDLYVSRSLDQVDAIAQQVVERRYSTVFTGGGDGTFMSFVNAIDAELARRGVRRPPRYGVLKLGTGNSLANLVGASSLSGDGILDDILRARANEVPSVRRLDLVTCAGKMAPFAGLGFDAAILNNYVELAKKGIKGGPGYFGSVVFMTLPRYLANPKPVQAEIVADGRTFRLDAEGKPVQEYAAGDVLYRGPINIAAAGTVPCYGYNFKIFPFAGKRRGMMHLRAASVSGTSCLANLLPMWNGTWRHPGIFDFMTEGATIRFERAMPLQVGGDAEGYRDIVKFGMAEKSVDLVDFTATLN